MSIMWISSARAKRMFVSILPCHFPLTLSIIQSCPNLWRRYSYLSAREREEALQHRATRIGLKLGEGGEGFIAWNAECFVCGDIGHWGYVSSRSILIHPSDITHCFFIWG